MAFIMEIAENRDYGDIRGKQEDVAVGCWFTAGGKAIPRVMKYQDGQGEIHKVENIFLITSEDKRYHGIEVKEMYCQAVSGNRKYYFKLLFRKEECKWCVIWL